MRLAYLPLMSPGESDAADPAAFAERVRRAVADELGVPLVDSDYRAVLALKKSRAAQERPLGSWIWSRMPRVPRMRRRRAAAQPGGDATVTALIASASLK